MVKRISLGAQPDGHYGLRVSKSGYDVTTNPVDNTQLNFNSDWPSLLPIYLKGSFSLTGSSSGYQGPTQTIAFSSLGFVPYVLIIYNGYDLPTGLTSLWIRTPGQVSQSTGLASGIYVAVTSTTLTVRLDGLSGHTYTIYYSILNLQAI